MMDIECGKKECDGRCDPMIISMADEVLTMGGLIVYPTETLYGIGGDATKEEIFQKINEIKGTTSKKISIAYSSVEHVLEYLELQPKALKLARKFLPGPLTIVVDTEDGTVGIRVPDHPLANKIIENFGPITSTSANIHGRQPAVDVETVKSQLGTDIDLYIDCGRARTDEGSTVIKIDGEIEVLREGIIERGELIG